MSSRRLISAFLTLLLYVSVAAAHHSAAMFDQNKILELEGVVKEFQFANPHAWLIVTVKNSDGTTTTWGVEAPVGPSVLINAGIRKADLKPGTAVRISGHPMRDGRPAMDWVKVVRVGDGKNFQIRP